MRMTTNANRRVTDEQIERARSIDLVQFLQQYEPPGELKRIGQSWTLKTHAMNGLKKADCIAAALVL